MQCQEAERGKPCTVLYHYGGPKLPTSCAACAHTCVSVYVQCPSKCPISPVVSPAVVGLEDLLETASDVVEDYCLKRLEGPLTVTTLLEEEEQTGAVGGDRTQASGGGGSSMVLVQRVLPV